jgi:Asp-tRNA(Asn)/Glu-tRNA(Gln) amidotransferase A subunit family amidase
MNRRTLLLAGCAAAVGAGAAASPVTTLSEWLKASRNQRKAALDACLERIRTLDPSIHAWVQVAPQPVAGDGKLAGIPFAAKDIMETRGLATEYGSPIYKGRLGETNAAIVEEFRRRGAILLGKTHTAAFAFRSPPPTRNPRNLEHTPGGSSSGSAAAVAAGMTPVALGTQTLGSVLRPASYCGITGFKASYGLLSLEGVLPFSKSLDTLGFYTHTPEDMLALWEALGHSRGRAESFAFGVPEPLPEVEPEMAAAFERAVATLRAGGVTLRPVDIAPMLVRLNEAARTVSYYEGARFHEQRYQEYGSRLDHLADLVREGLAMPVDRYEEARRVIADARARIEEVYKGTPVILAPAATGPAPRGLASTGDARMNAPWTALGTPAISIPMRVPNGALPLGLQLTAAHGQDARVLRAAIRVWRVLEGRR